MNIILQLKAVIREAFLASSDLQYHDEGNAARFQSISDSATQTVMVGTFKVNLGEMAQRAAIAATAHGADAKQALETALQVQVAAESGKDVEIAGGTIRIGHRTGDAVSICFD